MDTGHEDTIEQTVKVVQACMTDTLPCSELSEQLDMHRTTVWRRAGQVVRLTQTTMNGLRALAIAMEDVYIPLRQFFTAHAGVADRKKILASLASPAAPDESPDLTRIRQEYRAAVELTEGLFATALNLYEQAQQLTPPDTNEYDELLSALEEMRDFALLAQPRVRRAASLLGLAVTPGE